MEDDVAKYVCTVTAEINTKFVLEAADTFSAVKSLENKLPAFLPHGHTSAIVSCGEVINENHGRIKEIGMTSIRLGDTFKPGCI